eukprot:g2264.t1
MAKLASLPLWGLALGFLQGEAKYWQVITDGAPKALFPEAPPTARSHHSAIVDHVGRMWIFGGLYRSDMGPQQVTDQLYYLNLSNPIKWMNVDTRLQSRAEHSAVFDGAWGMWIFGGKFYPRSADNETFTTVHYLDLETLEYEVVECRGNGPSKRWRHSAVMDSFRRMWVYGGVEYDKPFEDRRLPNAN